MSPPESATIDTVIRGGTVIAFEAGEHRLLDGGDVALAGRRVAAVGMAIEAPGARSVDARGRIVLPGHVSTHAHVGAHEGPRLVVDAGRRDFVRSGFLHFLPGRRSGGPGFLAEQDLRASLRFGFASLLRHGVTTVLAFAPAGPDRGATMLEVASAFGIRLVWAPIVYGGRYWLGEGGALEKELDEAQGLRMLDEAARFITDHSGDGLHSGAIVVDEFHTSTSGLRRQAKRVATELGVPFSMHFVEQHREFFDTMTATGRTPVELLADEGVLDPSTILAHCIYVASHSLVGYPVADDIALLGQAGVSVAHSPVAFARRGVALESFDRYRAAGINVALGTDIYPMDMFGEMRTASVMGKMTGRTHEAAPAAAVFSAANLAAARAIGREDLGRIAPGAKADIVLLDTRRLAFGANPDPLRALVHLATPEMVDTVIVDGRVLVEAGRLLVADEAEVLAEARRSSERVWATYGAYDPSGRSVGEAFPPSLNPYRGGQA